MPLNASIVLVKAQVPLWAVLEYISISLDEDVFIPFNLLSMSNFEETKCCDQGVEVEDLEVGLAKPPCSRQWLYMQVVVAVTCLLTLGLVLYYHRTVPDISAFLRRTDEPPTTTFQITPIMIVVAIIVVVVIILAALSSTSGSKYFSIKLPLSLSLIAVGS